MWFILTVAGITALGLVLTLYFQRAEKRAKERERQAQIAAKQATQRAKDERARQIKQAHEAALREKADAYLDTIGDGPFLRHFPREIHYTQNQLDRMLRGQEELPWIKVLSVTHGQDEPEVRIHVSGKNYLVRSFACSCQDNQSTALPCKHMYALAPSFFGPKPPEDFTVPLQIKGRHFAFVGQFSAFPLEQAQRLLMQAGGSCANALGPDVDYVVEGADPGAAGAAAAGLGAQILSEAAFLTLLSQTKGKKSMDNTYTANGGQTYMPFQENIHVKTLPYEPLKKPSPPYAPLVLSQAAREKGWVIQPQAQHFLPGVSAAMLDWFWANMEKGYYLWAPGSHKRFSWVREPWKHGFLRSAHKISESVGEGAAVFGGSGVEIQRLNLEWFPFSTALEHIIVEGVFNGLGEFVDMTVHMWQDSPGGCDHITAAVASATVTQPPDFVLEMLAQNPNAQIVPPSATDHGEYEASRWPVFLPRLYDLWKDHPDPTQSVPCDLRAVRTGADTWEYVNMR